MGVEFYMRWVVCRMGMISLRVGSGAGRAILRGGRMKVSLASMMKGRGYSTSSPPSTFSLLDLLGLYLRIL